MITTTIIENKIYIGVDYPTPRPEIPSILSGKIYELYEYTYNGPKYIGKFMAEPVNDGKKVGPLHIVDFFSIIISYKGYYQYMEIDYDKKCHDCTYYEEFEEKIDRLIFTDKKDFLYSQISDLFEPEEGSLLQAYNRITYVDGVLRIGNKIRKVDDKILVHSIENDAVYYYTLDATKIPPTEIDKTKIIEIPVRIKNGVIKRARLIRNKIIMDVHYPNNLTMKIYFSIPDKKPFKLVVNHNKTCETVFENENTPPEILETLAQKIDEGGITTYNFIKHMSDIETEECW